MTVTLNPSVDYAIYVPGFRIGATNRVTGERSEPSGKGVNVAAYLAALGERVAVHGFLGHEDEERFVPFFRECGFEDHFIRVEGRTRANLKLIDPDRGEVTEVNRPGFTVTREALELIGARLDVPAPPGGWCILSGSVPPGLPDDVYAELIRLLKQNGWKVALDTSGAALISGVDAGPDFVKPNEEEVATLLGRLPASDVDVAEAVARFCDAGVRHIAVSLGARGAIFVGDGQRFHARAPSVRVESTVGAGDAMVAAFVAGVRQDRTFEEAARRSMAVAALTIGRVDRLLPGAEEIEEMAERIELHYL